MSAKMFHTGILMFLIVAIRCVAAAPQHQISNKFNHESPQENQNFIRKTPTKETEYESEMSSGEGDNIAENKDEDKDILENDGQMQWAMKSFANDTGDEHSETYVLRSGQTKKRDYPKLCTELSEFTPNLCDDELAQKRCEVYCGSDCCRILPPLACGKKLPPEPAGNPTQSDSEAESTRRSGESTGTKRVLGGQPAKEGEWPWTVRLLHSRSPDLYCGGAILNKRFILTNSRCFVTSCDVSKGRENCEPT